MSRLDELIQEYCPEGVLFRKLVDAASIKRGRRVTKNELSPDGAYPVYSGGVTPMGYFGKCNQPSNVITVVKYGTAGFVNFITEEFWANDVCYCIKPSESLNNKYLFYVLKDKQKLIQSQATDAIPAHLPTEVIGGVQIPIPPLEVQKEIVDILDKFTQLETELSAELAAELDARRMQYEYYRSQLLTFGESRESIRWLTLEEVCVTISAGGDLPKNYKKGQSTPTKELPYPIYSNGTEDKALYGFTDGYKIDREAVTISARGTIGYHTVRSPGFTPIVRLVTLIADTNYITSKYLNYALDITKIGHSGGSIPQLTVPNVKKLKVPVPSLAEQSRIVNLLDKLDALTNGISTDFPAEINFRRQQYEYYRTKLLTFQELPV